MEACSRENYHKNQRHSINETIAIFLPAPPKREGEMQGKKEEDNNIIITIGKEEESHLLTREGFGNKTGVVPAGGGLGELLEEKSASYDEESLHHQTLHSVPAAGISVGAHGETQEGRLEMALIGSGFVVRGTQEGFQQARLCHLIMVRLLADSGRVVAHNLVKWGRGR